ncbi:unnamed protein product [Rotaria sordida]|uniref:Uncharacterized protein n=1 Tax=Rotaria sordida TaxID=392033 RepID=A0A813PD00_9BILA|nr:unnamed protein product [Rotaria sordida]CAF3561444.1 unnamed protein product [Rotaria sordida]
MIILPMSILKRKTSDFFFWTSQFFPIPILRGQILTSGIRLVLPLDIESAWEHGLRSAKTIASNHIEVID